MGKRFTKLIFGILLSSFSIAAVIHAQIGVFPLTAANLAISNWFGISIGVSGMFVELLILLLAYRMGEGITLTGIVNATIGSLLIDVWDIILPYHPIMFLGVLLLPIAWYFSGSAGLGDTNQNLLTNALTKRTKKDLGFIRTCQEVLFLIIGLLGAMNHITFMTILLSLGFGYVMHFEYKLLRYDPSAVKHLVLKKGSAR